MTSRTGTESTVTAQDAADTLDARSRPVVVAMLTYRRPDDLMTAVPALVPHLQCVTPTATLIVIDNDPQASARAAVATFGPHVRYVHEPRPGIAAARNRALDQSPPDALLIFIDDDERPHPGWLTSLVDTHNKFGAAAVAGPVVSEYEHEPEEWIAAGRFFDRRRPATGTVIDVAATNNLLLDLQQVNRIGLRFDEKFGESGGSDTLFTRRLHRAGGLMVWCAEATVTDVVPAPRLTRDWVLRRAFRSGNSWGRVNIELSESWPAQVRARVEALGGGLIRLAGGAVRFVVGIVTGSLANRARGQRTMARGGGMVAAAVGITYFEYRRRA
ncbi:glycosyltransferase family 2 protein [Nakamurella sp.]|uniref:glycosyltransferase family 2 protein n=1 Tax=Nakamurella sp. TaxID=1869182 RepID=UPI003B3BC1EE